MVTRLPPSIFVDIIAWQTLNMNYVPVDSSDILNQSYVLNKAELIV